MSKVEMIYAASMIISLASITVFLTMLWERAEQSYRRKKRAKAQRIADRVNRHNEFIRNSEDYKAVLKW